MRLGWGWGLSKARDKSDSARLIHPWALENVREPANKGPWDQSPFLRGLVRACMCNQEKPLCYQQMSGK